MWVSLRSRPLYREMKEAIDDALTQYWEAAAQGTNNDLMIACEELTLTTYRLLTFIRNQIGGLIHHVDKDIGDLNETCVGFYCLGEGESTSFQEETDVLEILSRSAYRELKLTRKAIEELKELDQRIERD